MADLKLSVVIITYNEEKNIARCIHSVAGVADEILVVDSYSTDRTVEIAQSLSATVITHVFVGHIEQKNFALDQAKYHHVLSLDADETLSVALAETISGIKLHWSADAYRFNRLNNFCGQWIKHGLWYPDQKIRLWNRQKGRWGGRNPHDKVIMQEKSIIKPVSGDILHYTVDTVEQYYSQINKFSSIQANQLSAEGFRPGFFHLYMKPAYKFLAAYFFRLGFLDGWRGYMIAKGQALGVYLRYAKIRG
ncbi:MAG: glycosyltransferase family 2 protein [Saprospiraceae bacterium]|nr:glycosyltransferase family 2 protein [Saprospiraceae bacterium]